MEIKQDRCKEKDTYEHHSQIEKKSKRKFEKKKQYDKKNITYSEQRYA